MLAVHAIKMFTILKTLMSTVNMYVAVSFSEQVRETDSDGIHQQLSIIRKLLL